MANPLFAAPELWLRVLRSLRRSRGQPSTANGASAKLKKIGIPAPTREQFVIWRSFLTVLFDCAIRGDVEKAKGVLKDLSPEVDVLRVAQRGPAD